MLRMALPRRYRSDVALAPARDVLSERTGKNARCTDARARRRRTGSGSASSAGSRIAPTVTRGGHVVIDTGNQADRKLDELVPVAHRVSAAVETVISGKPGAIRLAMTVLLAEGHVLIEDVPGVGKTLLAKALARSIDCSVRRVQFTPDLLPGDLTGVSAFNQELREFEFKPGPIFANIVLGDEINRASPKTQSALLECMEERQVTVDGATYPLELPFMVIATQNPIEMEGTYPLRDAELSMLDSHGSSSPLDALEPVAHGSDVRALIAAVRGVHVAQSIRQYVI